MPATPPSHRLSDALDAWEDAYRAAVADGQITMNEQARLLRLFKSVRTLWQHQEAGIRLARIALGYGGASPKLARLEREYREDLGNHHVDAA